MLAPVHPKKHSPKTATLIPLYTKATKENRDIFENFSGILQESGLCSIRGQKLYCITLGHGDFGQRLDGGGLLILFCFHRLN
jgi:hypothetical protein